MKKFIWIFILSILTTPSSFAGQYIASDGIPVENQFIVVLKDDAPSTQARKALLENLATQHGAKLLRTYSRALNGGVMEMTETKAKALARHALVDYIEQDSVVQLIVPISTNQQQSPTPSWGLDRIDQQLLPLDNAYNYTNNGAGVTAYVIDTGIYIEHGDFSGRASVGTDIINDGNGDCNGHGTHVAGTIGGTQYGVAKNVNLVSVRVLNCTGSGTTSGVIAGVDWVTTTHTSSPAVANMSLGGGRSTALDTAVNNSINDGVTYVVAAGNSGRNACYSSPARVPAAITVGATSETDDRPSWSNYGRCLDLFAPGLSITSDWIAPLLTNTISGTSMASPHVAGVVALMLEENAIATPSQISTALINESTKGIVINPGRYSPNRLLYTSH